MVLLKAMFVWLGIIAAESLQGAVRILLVAPLIGDLPARRLAVLTGSALVLLIAWLTIPSIRPKGRADALRVGAVWVVMTMLFDAGLGRLTGASWQRVWSDYDLPEGGLLPLGLAVMLFAPWLAMAARARRESRNPPRTR